MKFRNSFATLRFVFLTTSVLAQSSTTYAISFIKRGAPLKEFIATKDDTTKSLCFISAVNSDLTLTSADPTTSPADKTHVILTYQNKNLTKEWIKEILYGEEYCSNPIEFLEKRFRE